MSQYSHLSIPNKEWVQATSELPLMAPPVSSTLPELRRLLSDIVKTTNETWNYPKSGLQVTDVSIPVQGASIKVRIYVPESGGNESFPVLVWYHGGGFKVGDLELDDAFLRLICKTNRVSVVNVDYRLAPEHPFPIPLEDSFDALKWVAANASSFSGDVRKGLLVGGPSAGGNLTAVVALRARDDPELKGKLTGQILQVPMICSPPAYPEKWKSELLSMDQNKDAPLLTRHDLEGSYNDYQAPDLTSPDIAPLLAPNHQGLPPAYVQVCGLDPLRDEAFLYEKILRESGVPTKIECYPGLPHYFWGYIPSLSCSEKFRGDTLAGVKWLIERKGE